MVNTLECVRHAETVILFTMASGQFHVHTEAQVFVFMTLHYPSADNAQALAQGMAQIRGWMESQPGCLGVEPPLLSEDGTCLVGFSRWESEEALLATGIDLESLAETPSSELRPWQPYLLTAWPNGSA